jgi:outer membrane protein assembly factor BamD (BamD/ComL family)
LDEYPDAKEPTRATWHYLRSLGYLGLSRFGKASKELGKTKSLTMSDELVPLIEIARATALFGMQNYSLAVRHYDRYLQLAPEGADVRRAMNELTICYTETGQWQKAAQTISETTTKFGLDSSNLKTTQFVAEKAFELGNLESAETLFEILAHPENPKEYRGRGLSGLAWIKMENEDTEGGYAIFERLLTECPESDFSGEAALARAKFLEESSDLQGAAQMYGLVVRRFQDPKLVNVARLRRAYLLQKLGGDVNLKEAKTLLEEFLKSPGDLPKDEAVYQMAWVLHDLKQHEKSRDTFAQLVENHPTCKYVPDAAYRLIQDYMSKGDTKSAQPLITKLLGIEDVPPEVYSRVLFLNGQLAAGENRWSDVESSMSELSQREIEPALLQKSEYWLAESLYRQKKYKASLEQFVSLTERMKNKQDKLEPWIRLRTAQCYGYTNQWQTAVEIAKKAKTDFPSFEADYEYDFVLARGLEDDGMLADARTMYTKVIHSKTGKSTETAAVSQWRIGETYFHQEQYVNAINAYYKVDSLFSYPRWRSAALMQAGKCQEHLRNHLHAIKLYTQLIETFPESQYVSDAKRRMANLNTELPTNAKTSQAKSSSTPRR